jgi:Icc-related predicted phosphoesterase
LKRKAVFWACKLLVQYRIELDLDVPEVKNYRFPYSGFSSKSPLKAFLRMTTDGICNNEYNLLERIQNTEDFVLLHHK